MQHDVHPADLAPAKLLAECDVRRQRRSGPGGQHRNKVATAVVIVHQPTGIRCEATEQRSQAANQRVAIHRLRVKLAIQVRSNRETGCGGSASPYSASPLWRSRLRAQKISIARTHEDFPSLLAEALDCLSTLDLDVKECAQQLGTSPSQLVRFFKLEPDALIYVNERRAKQELKPLR
jgi:AraC-like DNA-binding protein